VARELALAYAIATAVAAALFRVGPLRDYYSALVAALLLYLPAAMVGRTPLARYGLTHRPLGRSLAYAAVAVALIFPLFLVGYASWQRLACAVRWLHPMVLGPCAGSVWARFHPRLPQGALELAAAQLLVVALPEEFFFRGYLQGRLAEAWPGARRVLGAPLGPIAVASALFALCHWAVQWNPLTLTVFFPGLVFGWMRARTGSTLAGTLFHAACNLYIESLHVSFFG
jgi:membrane protease YdiL (CAAX protease family)